MYRTLGICTLLLIGYFTPARSQAISPTPGSRVRISAPDLALNRVTGRVVSADADSLVLERGPEAERLVIPVGSLGRLEVSRGRSHWEGARTGWGLGSVAGGLIGGTWAVIDEVAYNRANEIDLNAGWTTLVFFGGFLAGGLIGAPVGLLAGSIIGREQWDKYLLSTRIGLGISSAGGMGLNTTIPLR